MSVVAYQSSRVNNLPDIKFAVGVGKVSTFREDVGQIDCHVSRKRGAICVLLELNSCS
jgi:hypothetical protein